MSYQKSNDVGQPRRDGTPQHQRYLNDLYQIASDTTLSFQEKIEQLLTVGCDYFDVGIGMLTHEQKDCFEIEQMVGSHPVIGEGTLTPPMTENYCRHVVETGETVCVHDAGEAGWEDDALYHELNLECYAGVKVSAKNETYGTLAFSDLSPRDRTFTSVDRTFLELMGQCVNYELERKQRVDYLTALNALSRELMGVKTATGVSECVVEAANTTLDLPITAIALYDADRDELRPVARTDAAEEILDVGSLLNGKNDICRRAYDDGTSRRVSDPLEGAETPTHPSVTEFAIFPLDEYGVFVTGSSATDGFQRTDFDFVETVAAGTKAALDRAEREQELKRQNSRLESFASMLAHELRNPLSIAQIYHEQAVNGDEDAADEVVTALERIEEMIDVLLVTARKGESVIDGERVVLADAATDAWTDLSAPRSADLVVETEQAIRSDPVHIHHMLENLFQNSVEHGNSTVNVRVGDLGDGFYVEDDGPGISADENQTVFEAGHTTETDSFGLGLTFVKQLAELYGWDCSLAESEYGGARFEFTHVDICS